MSELNNITASENFMRVMAEGRLIRGAFNRTAPDGRALACAYAAAVTGATSTA